MQEPNLSERINTDEDNDTTSTNFSKRIDIIKKKPNQCNRSFHEYDFDNVIFRSLGDTSNSEAKIEKLDRIPMHDKLIKELLSNKEMLEYYLTNNFEEVIDILTHLKLLEENTTTP